MRYFDFLSKFLLFALSLDILLPRICSAFNWLWYFEKDSIKVINVKSIGAKVDGLSDDYLPIQQTIDQGSSNLNREVSYQPKP